MSLWDKMNDRDRNIVFQVVYKECASWFKDIAIDGFSNTDDPNFATYRQRFANVLKWQWAEVQGVLQGTESFDDARSAAATVGQSFPGAVDVTAQQPTFTQAAAAAPPADTSWGVPQASPAPPSNVVPFPQPQAAPQPLAQPGFAPPAANTGGGGNKKEQLWADLFNNPQNWNDVRNQKRSPNSPDFQHKFQRNQNGKEEALWLVSQYGNAPAWVFQRLGLQPQ
jgi:hypothetical protein